MAIVVKQYTGEGAITALSIVKNGSATGKVAQASAVGDRLLGVVMNTSDVADGGTVYVCRLGPCQLRLGSSGSGIGFAAYVTTDASGLGVVAAPAAGTNNNIVGQAEAAGANNGVIEVMVGIGRPQG